jgi:hypothetical protein
MGKDQREQDIARIVSEERDPLLQITKNMHSLTIQGGKGRLWT